MSVLRSFSARGAGVILGVAVLALSGSTLASAQMPSPTPVLPALSAAPADTDADGAEAAAADAAAAGPSIELSSTSRDDTLSAAEVEKVAAQPHVSYTGSGLVAAVNGSTVTASVTLKASRTVDVSEIGICVRDSASGNRDFPKDQGGNLPITGRTILKTQTFQPGTYTYWGCAKVNGGWYNVGQAKAFTIKAGATTSTAHVSYSTRDLDASVNGSSVTAKVTIAATRSVTAGQAGICVKNAAGVNQDFVKDAGVTLGTGGRTFTKTKSYVPGTYTYWGCAMVNGGWYNIGEKKTFTVRAADGGRATAGGEDMPADAPGGWTRVFSEDFATAQDKGHFPGVYGAKWRSYHGFPDTSQKGDYDQGIISVHDGALDVNLGTGADGRPKGAAPIPLLDDSGKVTGQVYGRYTMRFKADNMPGYGMAGLLWPSSGTWADGEIDFPEGAFDGGIWAYTHCVGNPQKNCSYLETGVGWSGWHTATIEWMPGRINYILDGKVLQTVTKSVPTKAMQWVLQTGTMGDGPAKGTKGHLLIDWVTVERWNG
ncbi:glycoside hydrolase family 16 protein [Nakamurella flavida]|uniref:Glycoside hydrolase family 16 protein n=1 Tax=Nakamurella flavida TaxID=363630 RepID=A0A938YJ63_9ACTN|nr:glycoside hydrolase family 16 protein [Nakamurella flavida]MBM9475713.1 glycoside hydrolase family 16 protein [Nakamurella flavida]MDP9778009.1 hypothetical protein [Nakamurella flavida]